MRHFPHLLPPDLPPLMRVLSLFGLLFILASGLIFILALPWQLGFTSLSSPPPSLVASERMGVIASNLTILSLACSFMVNTYRIRLSQPGRGPFPLSSWQSQMRFIALVAALPICAIVLAFVIPPTAGAFIIVFPISIIGVVVLLVANLSIIIRRQAVD